MKKSLFYSLLFIQCSIDFLFHLNGMQKKNDVVFMDHSCDKDWVEVRLNGKKIQELSLPQKHTPSILKFSNKGSYFVVLMKNTSQIDPLYDQYSVGFTNEIEYPKYSFIIWSVCFANNGISHYKEHCRFKFDHRFPKEVRFSDEETMIVVDFDNESSVDFYPDLIVLDEDCSINIEESMKNGSLREIQPKSLNFAILKKYIDTILDSKN